MTHPPTAPAFFDPWTSSEDDVIKAVKMRLKSESPYDYFSELADPTGPALQRNVAKAVTSLQEICLAGDSLALMWCVAMCGKHRLHAPTWLAEAFELRVQSVLDADAVSWDRAFGRPYKAGTHAKTLKARRQQEQAIYEATVDEAILKRRGLTAPLFEEIGARFGVGGRTAEARYRAAVSRGRVDLAEQKKFMKTLSQKPHMS